MRAGSEPLTVRADQELGSHEGLLQGAHQEGICSQHGKHSECLSHSRHRGGDSGYDSGHALKKLTVSYTESLENGSSCVTPQGAARAVTL